MDFSRKISRASLLAVGLGLLLGACGPKPQPYIPPPPPPPKPVGDIFALAPKVGDAGGGKVVLRIASEQPGPKGKRLRVERSFNLSEEHKVTAVDPDGTQHVEGHLLDIEGKDENPKGQKEVDGQARGLQEMKITFNRSPQGEVSMLTTEGLPKTLDPNTARLVAGYVYGAGRGPLFVTDRKEAGQDWKIRAEVPLQAGSNNLDLDYHFDKKDGTVATVTFKGTSSGKAGDITLAGELTGQFLFDLGAGRFVSQLLDQKSVRGDGVSQVTQQIHVEWQGNGAAAVAAPAAAEPAAADAPKPAATPAVP